jgi:multidrug efflux pump
MIMRYNTYLSAAINGNTAPGVSSGDAIAAVQKLTDAAGVPFEWTEITYLQILAGSAGIFVFFIGSIFVYLVLAAKYESWSLPLGIIMVVPMCLLCSVTGMLIVHLPIDIFVQIGFLVLVGMAAKNAILIVEFAEQLRAEGRTVHEAIVESSRLRLRPIVMTSFAFILGVVPLVLGTGAGAEMRRSLGTAVFSGMIGVTFFGVVLTPVFYAFLMWLTHREKPRPAAVAVPTHVDKEPVAMPSAPSKADGAITTAQHGPVETPKGPTHDG